MIEPNIFRNHKKQNPVELGHQQVSAYYTVRYILLKSYVGCYICFGMSDDIV